jgi:hypothetical protein
LIRGPAILRPAEPPNKSEVPKRVQSTFFDERRAYREEQAGLREYLALFCR